MKDITAMIELTYNPSTELALPSTIERVVKSTRARRNMVSRRKISLNLA